MNRHNKKRELFSPCLFCRIRFFAPNRKVVSTGRGGRVEGGSDKSRGPVNLLLFLSKLFRATYLGYGRPPGGVAGRWGTPRANSSSSSPPPPPLYTCRSQRDPPLFLVPKKSYYNCSYIRAHFPFRRNEEKGDISGNLTRTDFVQRPAEKTRISSS